MAKKLFKLVAEISTGSPKKIEVILTELIGIDGIVRNDNGFKVTRTMEGESARQLNRELLSALRRVEKKTTLRAEWTHGKSTERFFDYVPKGIRQA
ncbi:MAG TPA: hypothetical protein VIS48_12880 [Candidatus Kryptonia bacterium]